MITADNPLRIAFVAGTLNQGGAEKQLVNMVKSLADAGAEVRVYTTSRGEYYESLLREMGCDVIWFGHRSNPLPRMARLTRLLRQFRPHVVQSAHFYTNLYATAAGRANRAITFGSLRNDAVIEVEANGRWGPWLIRMPPSIIANSHVAKENAARYGVEPEKVHLVSNVIDLDQYDLRSREPSDESLFEGVPTAIAVGRLVKEKRIDRFIQAIHLASQQVDIRGAIVGDGPQRTSLESVADDLGLGPDRLRFLGRKPNPASLMRQSDMLVTCSDHEGFPNVLLESMAAGIPAIGMPAGDVSRVMQDGTTGFLVPFDDIETMVNRMVSLARDADLRRTMGAAARDRVEKKYGPENLANRIFAVYQQASVRQRRTSRKHPLLGLESPVPGSCSTN